MPSEIHEFTCSACGATHRSADRRLPVLWARCGSDIWCTDCNTLGLPARRHRSGRRNRAA